MKLILVSIFILGAVGLVGVSWEGFEWIMSYWTGKNYQGSLTNTMFDIYTTIVGGIIGLVVISILDKFVHKLVNQG